MNKRTFYKFNALAWGLLVLVAAKPLSKVVTELWQFWAVMAFAAAACYLAWKSMRLLEYDK